MIVCRVKKCPYNTDFKCNRPNVRINMSGVCEQLCYMNAKKLNNSKRKREET